MERLASRDEDSTDHAKLQLRVHIGELGVHEAIHQLRRKNAGFQAHGLQGAEASASVASTRGPEEIRADRKKDELLEAYRRLTRPDRVQRNWSADRWAAVSQLLTKLRSLAGAAGWRLLPPAIHLSRDPQALSETDIDDPVNAAEVVDIAEGAIEARILRIATRLVVDKNISGRVAEVKSWISSEAYTFARLALAHLRTTELAIETLLDPESMSPSHWVVLAKSYGAFAASITSLREHLGDDIDKVLQDVQDNLSKAATAACKLGLAAGPMISPPASGGQTVAASRLARSLSKTPVEVANAVAEAARDPFKPLHQSTLLSSIALLAEVVWTSMDGAPGAADPQKTRLGEDSDQGLSKFDAEATIADLADWPVEFTSSQLGRVQRALRDRQPNVVGALALLQDTLDHYARLAEAMGRAYGNERALRANPSDFARHKGLVGLLRQLRSSWRDTGAVLVPSRQADLLALERVRLRHQGLVFHAFSAGGHEVAAVVLARLALVDEMLEPPDTRRLTGEVPWEWKRPYNVVEGIIRGLRGEDGLAARQFRRRRRWLRCPHSTTRMVLAGDIWRQLFARFFSVKTGFEGLGGCFDIPLTLREFRVASCFLELTLSDHQLAMIHGSAADVTAQLTGESVSGQATLRNLQRMVNFFGPQGSGDFGVAAEAALSASKALESKALESKDDDSSSSEGPADQGAQSSTSPQVSNSPKALLAPSVCPRCLAGDMPNFPHVSVGELNRRHGPAALSDGGTTQAQVHSDEEAAARELGEDLMAGWATSVLASGILLSKDEQGAYFRWLARTVLYSTEEIATDSPSKSAGVPEAKARVRGGRARRASVHNASRRLSFASSLTAALPLMDSYKGLDREAARNGEGGAADGTINSSEAGDLDMEGLQEARDDIARALPEATLSALRIDLGLSPASQDLHDDDEVKRTTSLELGDRHRHPDAKTALTSTIVASIQARMAKDEVERTAKRASREAKLIACLRAVGVKQSELNFLQQEFTHLASEAPRNSKELLLMGGAARAAQSIVVPNPALKLKHAQEGGAIESTFASQSARDDCSNRATAIAAVGRRAQEVLDASALHTSHCYSRLCSGYAPENCRYRVAAALRLLEHELFSVAEGGSAEAATVKRGRRASNLGSEDDDPGNESREKTAVLAHMLLPRDAARRLIIQLKREELESAIAAPTAQLLGASTERRKAMPFGHSVRVLSMERGDSDSSESFDSTPTASPSNRRRRRPSVTRSPSMGTKSPKPSSPASSVQTPSSKVGNLRSAVRRIHGVHRQNSTVERGENGSPKAERVASPAAPSTPQAPMQLTSCTPKSWQDLSDWPEGVRGLFDSVDARGRRLRFATRLGLSAGDRDARSKSSSAFYPKSKSTGALPSASAGHGATPPSSPTLRASGQHCSRQLDRVLTDGWRAKLPASTETSFQVSPTHSPASTLFLRSM